jgi:ABC-type phosphate transport system auxiliary subunit
MHLGELVGLLIVVGIPTILLIYMARRFFSFREKQLDAETSLAAEKAAQYAASNSRLEARVAVLEQIVTDRGAETASQIEALREKPRIAGASKVRERDSAP